MKSDSRVTGFVQMPHPMLIQECENGKGFWGMFPDLPGCTSQGGTWEEVRAMLLDAKTGWVEAMLASGEEIPEPEEPLTYLTMRKALTRVAKEIDRLRLLVPDES